MPLDVAAVKHIELRFHLMNFLEYVADALGHGYKIAFTGQQI
jgi:hypothetical protein